MYYVANISESIHFAKRHLRNLDIKDLQLSSNDLKAMGKRLQSAHRKCQVEKTESILQFCKRTAERNFNFELNESMKLAVFYLHPIEN